MPVLFRKEVNLMIAQYDPEDYDPTDRDPTDDV